MNGRIQVTLGLGVALLLATACSTANAGNSTANAATRGASTAATMTPAEMAAMGTPTQVPAAQATAPAAQPAARAAQPTSAAAQPAAPTATSAPTINAVATTGPAPALTAAPATTSAPAGPASTVTVTLLDMAIKLSAPSASAGTITFNITNGGTTTHELVVLRTSIPQNALGPDPANPGVVLEPGFLGKVANLAPHASGSLTLTLGSGSYVLICNEPAHYSALGMHTAFSIQ